MMLLSIHIGAIALLIAIVAPIAYQIGKKEGIRVTKNYYEEQQDSHATSQGTTSQGSPAIEHL